jgi:hypothetical protein
MREITDIHPQALAEVDTADLIHGEIMNEMVRLQEIVENPLDQHNKAYYNGMIEGLLGVYGLLNDIQWHKEKLERSSNE